MNLRLASANILSRVIKEGQSLTAALDYALATVEDKKEGAFIQALCYGVIRQYHRLDYILQQLLPKPLRNKDHDIKMLLLIGLYQLKYMRVKPHAAVSETVSAAKKKSWAKSLINGVLRRYTREQSELEQKADDNTYASISHPEWLVAKITTDWGLEQANVLFIENNKQPPMALRVNLAKITREAYLDLLSEASIKAFPVLCCSAGLILEQAVGVEKLPKFKEGYVSVQDTAAQLAAELLDAQPNHTVLDLCAAPGGKTAAILEREPAVESVLAVDIDETRLIRVKENLQRLNLRADVVMGDATDSSEWGKGQQFDRILVDVPCSALGVIRRHPDIKVLRRESDIDALQALQQKILQTAWALLKPEGVLLYATCSVLKQENEAQLEFFLKENTDAVELLIEADWGVKQKVGRQILTGDQQMDGFYYAKLVKHC